MSLLWNMVNQKNDETKTKVEQFKACIENLQIKDLELLLEECKHVELTQVILDQIVRKRH